MSLTIHANDPRAGYVGTSVQTRANDAGKKVTERLLDQAGRVYEIGRGESDPRITYLALFNTNGTITYLYPDAAGTALVVTPTKP